MKTAVEAEMNWEPAWHPRQVKRSVGFVGSVGGVPLFVTAQSMFGFNVYLFALI